MSLCKEDENCVLQDGHVECHAFTAPKCETCHQWSDFEARITSILAFYGILESPKHVVSELNYINAIRRIRAELKR